MNDLFEKFIEFIDRNNKIIVRGCVTLLGIIVIAIFIFISADSFTVTNESDQLLDYIEQRNYSLSVSYYDKVKKEFSPQKMERFSKSFSRKVNKVLMNYGDKYIKGEIGKEYYISLINIINELDTINLDMESILNQVKRVNELYLAEKLTYNSAMGYMQAISNLKISKNDIDSYTKKIEVIEDSRKIYNLGLKYQNKKMYKEAIENYDKVISEDKKYYELAQKKKETCIDQMYDYYIEKAQNENQKGEYQNAIEYINYLKEYYIDDAKLNELSKEYEKNLQKYTLNNDEIINLISKKSGINRSNITINAYQQIIDGTKYYYVEAFNNGEQIDEFLVEARSRKLYSYLDENKSYNNYYSDGYWRRLENGQIDFSINKNNAESILEKKLSEKNEKYKYIRVEDKDKALRYVKNSEIVDKFIKNRNDIHYYLVVNRGIFKSKQVYMMNVYTKQIYIIDENGIKGF